MSTPEFEALLVRLYTEESFRGRFFADPEGEARRAGLNEAQLGAVLGIDRHGLTLAARGFEHKRKRMFQRRNGWLKRLRVALFH